MEAQKTILIHTDFALAKTGFARSIKAILKPLHATGKYKIIHYCMNAPYSMADLNRTPWKSIGCIPNNQNETNQYLSQYPQEQREHKFREICYGIYYIDKIVAEYKPDVYFGIQDIWGLEYVIGRKWFNDINSVIWTTLDSLPILPGAVEKAPLIKNYWIWSDFATKALHALGHKHVKTVHGAIEANLFFRLSQEQRSGLRQFFSIPQDAFVTGFVFRNQLRKSVPNLLEGYKLFKKRNSGVESRLLLHTHYSEGWNIHRLADEYGVDKNEILATYFCKACKNYDIRPYTVPDMDCKFCGAKKSQNTPNVIDGVSEEQLNQIYNLMDVYCHPFTSGGQEIPIEEAKLAELITLVTNYSCGEEMNKPEAKSLALEWSEYREHGTEFRKASTCPESIAKQLSLVYSTPKKTREAWGKQARDWTMKNFSAEAVVKILEDFIDKCPKVTNEKAFDLTKDPSAVIPDIKDNKEYAKALYREILKVEVADKDGGLIHWIDRLEKGEPRPHIEKLFRNIAEQDNLKMKGFDLEDWLLPDDKGKRILLVIPESIGDVYIITSLFPSIRKLYPNYSLYVATKPEYMDVLGCNPHVTKVIQYIPQMENLIWLEGQWDQKGYFEIAFLPFAGTQRFLDYMHNGKDRIQYDIDTRMIKWHTGEKLPSYIEQNATVCI